MADSVNVALDSSVSMARWLSLRAEWNWPLNLQPLSCDKMLTQWPPPSRPPFRCVTSSQFIWLSPTQCVISFLLEPGNSITPYKHTAPDFCASVCMRCISLKYTPQSWRGAHCCLPKTLSIESKLCASICAGELVNICGLRAAIWIRQVEILGGVISLWLTAVQMVYSCLLPRELTLNIYNEANAEHLAAALRS